MKVILPPGTTLLLARHGQTDLNIDERWQGRSDLPLNATGLAQAQALAASLPAGIEVIIASPLQRAQQTAQATAQRLQLPVQAMAAFRERDFGVLEGLTAAEAQAQWPGLDLAATVYAWDQAPPGGETTRAVVTRVRAGLAELLAQHAGRSVLLVSHGFVVRCLRHLLDGVPEADFFAAGRIPNGSFLTRRG